LTPTGGIAEGYATSGSRLGIVGVDGGPRAVVDLEFQNVVGYADGILVFGRTGGRILAVRFDVGARKVVGEPLSIVDNVKFKVTSGVQAVMSDNGTLAYLTGTAATRLEVVDENGKVSAVVSDLQGRVNQAAWSPDGKRLAFILARDAKYDIWVYDTETRVTSRITQIGDATAPTWTADGKRIGFVLNPLGHAVPAYWVAADGSGIPQEIPGTAGLGVVRGLQFSRDGKFAVVRIAVGVPFAGRAETQLQAIPLGGGAPVVVPASAKSIGSLSLSPNGKWFAYTSFESGREEVYVRPFPSGGGRLQISVNGGLDPRWSPDSKRLWYRTTTSLRFAALDVSGAMPKILGSDSLTAGELHDVAPIGYDVHPDGRHLAVVRDAGEGAKLVVVTNWLAEVNAKLKRSR
jgi:eukaryotic-like serine/threonine-protein kinase